MKWIDGQRSSNLAAWLGVAVAIISGVIAFLAWQLPTSPSPSPPPNFTIEQRLIDTNGPANITDARLHSELPESPLWHKLGFKSNWDYRFVITININSQFDLTGCKASFGSLQGSGLLDVIARTRSDGPDDIDLNPLTFPKGAMSKNVVLGFSSIGYRMKLDGIKIRIQCSQFTTPWKEVSLDRVLRPFE